ncbi:MAG: ABC transporter ATP-binding protein [Bacilli bacterium]|jgi:ABC-2 type transport system ATP-binding protein|nr:ABC transporter ATP-binding protein [Bacilli bacterium]
MAIIETENLCKQYGKTQALHFVNLKINEGKIVGLLGPNGSGKTTLIKIINNILQPTSGSILIDGIEPGIKSKEIISYLPDCNFLNEEMKISSIINYFKDFFKNFDLNKCYYLLSQMNVRTDVKLKTLSKGNKERVQLALILSRDAKIYVLDEPIAGVDPINRDFILKLIIENYNPDSTLLISTHLIQDIESILDEVIFINEGSIILHEDAEKLRSEKNMSINDIFKEELQCLVNL